MKFFIVVQDDLKDNHCAFDGPFSSLTAAKKQAENEYSDVGVAIVTILAQDHVGTFSQASQAKLGNSKFPWT